ncbi:WD40/YVTN/BNR-like repeat-containing protein [Lyngbya aestuarii]|uniref:WD40/YVTN/BNR-like repeat-containing protein n=1 Tax=Lyngbya aestuarii TaxID=118322 RepID=UPI00403E2850
MKFIRKNLKKDILLYLLLALLALFLTVYARSRNSLFAIPINSSLSTLPTEKSLFTTPNGELYEWSDVKIGAGGFVTGLVIHPTVPDIVYARTDVGGVFRWNPANQTWKQLLRADNVPHQTPINIESVAIAPSNPNILYAATGAYTKTDEKGVTPGTLLKSSDRGNTWQVLNLKLPMGGNEPWRWTGERLAVDPNNTSVVYFGSRLDGLWHSEDSGASWNQVSPSMVPLGEPHPETDRRAGVTYAVFDPSLGTVDGKTKVIYAGVSGKGIYRTTDAGTTWQLLSGGPSTDLVPQQGALTKNGELITTFYRQQDDSRGGVWKFARDSWQNITPEQGKNYSAVAVDPNKPDTIFVVTYPMTPNGVYRSDNGGANWVSLKNRLDKLPWWPSWSFWSLSGGIAVSPFHPGQVWLTNGIGVWQTENGYDNQVKWSAAVNGIEETVTFDAISTPDGASLITAIADFDGFRHESLSSFPKKSHENEVFNTTTSIAYSSKNPNFVVSVGASHHEPWVRRAGFSTDNARTWQNFPSIKKKTHPDDLVFGNVAVSATNTKNIVWQPSNSKPPYFTKDRGATWQKISFFEQQEIGSNIHSHLWNRQQALAADSVQGGTFYLYHQEKGLLLCTRDGGETWKVANNTLPSRIWNGANLKSAPGMAGEVWVSLKEQGLYRSSNFGQDFVKVAMVEEAQVLGFGKAAAGTSNPTIFIQGKVEGNSGVFRSIDLGATWVRVTDYPDRYYGESRVLVGDMNVFGRVFLGTGGNGFIYGQPSKLTQKISP